jgi:hypothetical protein
MHVVTEQRNITEFQIIGGPCSCDCIVCVNCPPMANMRTEGWTGKRKEMDRHTLGQADRGMEEHAVGQRDGQTERWKDKGADRGMDGQRAYAKVSSICEESM